MTFENANILGYQDQKPDFYFLLCQNFVVDLNVIS